jgi:hypothetical protein
MSLTHPDAPVYHPGLLSLLAYAQAHLHSRQWVAAIHTLLARQGVAR